MGVSSMFVPRSFFFSFFFLFRFFLKFYVIASKAVRRSSLYETLFLRCSVSVLYGQVHLYIYILETRTARSKSHFCMNATCMAGLIQKSTVPKTSSLDI